MSSVFYVLFKGLLKPKSFVCGHGNIREYRIQSVTRFPASHEEDGASEFEGKRSNRLSIR